MDHDLDVCVWVLLLSGDWATLTFAPDDQISTVKAAVWNARHKDRGMTTEGYRNVQLAVISPAERKTIEAAGREKSRDLFRELGADVPTLGTSSMLAKLLKFIHGRTLSLVEVVAVPPVECGFDLNTMTIMDSIGLERTTSWVTLPCGHSFDVEKITTWYNGADDRNHHTCPTCRAEIPDHWAPRSYNGQPAKRDDALASPEVRNPPTSLGESYVSQLAGSGVLMTMYKEVTIKARGILCSACRLLHTTKTECRKCGSSDGERAQVKCTRHAKVRDLAISLSEEAVDKYAKFMITLDKHGPCDCDLDNTSAIVVTHKPSGSSIWHAWPTVDSVGNRDCKSIVINDTRYFMVACETAVCVGV